MNREVWWEETSVYEDGRERERERREWKKKRIGGEKDGDEERTRPPLVPRGDTV